MLKLQKAKYLHVGDTVLPYDANTDLFINRPYVIYCIDNRFVYARDHFSDCGIRISKVKNVLKYV